MCDAQFFFNNVVPHIASQLIGRVQGTPLGCPPRSLYTDNYYSLMPGSATTASACPRTGKPEQMEPLASLEALPSTSLLGAVGQHLLAAAAAHEALHYITDICGNNN